MGNKKPKFKPVAQLRPDSKGRVTFSKLASGVSSYNVFQDEDGRLLLEPMVEIPAREKWLFENPEALASLRRGLEEAKDQKIVRRSSFTQYTEEDDET